MKLSKYLDENGIAIAKFARIIGVSDATVQNILREERDLRLSIALKIEDATKKTVTCRDLLPKKMLKNPPK